MFVVEKLYGHKSELVYVAVCTTTTTPTFSKPCATPATSVQFSQYTQALPTRVIGVSSRERLCS